MVIAAAADASTAPELIVDIDFNDEVWMRDHKITEAEVGELVKALHDNGCTTIIYRAGLLGVLPYRTELTYPMVYNADDARNRPCRNIKNVEAHIKQRIIWTDRYAEVIEDFNPPEAFVKAGHALGMKVIIWMDLFDDGYPGFRSKFLDENPHLQWTARDGKTYFEGVTDYAWPEARAFRITQAKELLALGADGIHCSTSSHCRHMPNVHEEDYYGYSEPIVKAYQDKYGVDIRTADDFDKQAWHDIKGDAMVQLYRELAALCHGQGKELWVGLQLGEHTQLCADPHFSDNVVARYRNHWKTLVDEGIADVFILADYEIAATPNDIYWKPKTDIVRREGEDLFMWAARTYQDYCKGKTKLFLFSEWLPGSTEALEHRMMQWAHRTVKNGFDGIDVHEAWNFESHPGNMAVLGKFSEALKKRPGGESK